MSATEHDDETITVFSPALLTSITVETSAEGTEIHVHPAGQGYWVARMLAVLGSRPVLCCTAGGELGNVARLLVPPEITLTVAGTAGAAGGYIDDRRGGERERLAVCRTAAHDRHTVDDLVTLTLAAAIESGIAVLTGSNEHGCVPSDVYRVLASTMRSLGVRVVVDLSGEELASALAGGVDLAKVSTDELFDDDTPHHDDDLVAAATSLAKAGADLVAVTMGAEGGVVVVDAAGVVARAYGPQLEAVDPRGAGDSFTAGAVVGMRRGGQLDDWLRLGIAAGASNVTRHGLGSGERVAIERLTAYVTVER